MNVPTRRTALLAVCAAVALAVAALVRPAPSPLPRTGAGDPALAALAREVVGPDRPALAVAAVTAGSTRTAVLGAAPDTRFEIGSITKGLTGLLFAEMVGRGEVTPTTTVGALPPVSGPLAAVTLEQLATHRSGLPSVPGGPGPFVRVAQRRHRWLHVVPRCRPAGGRRRGGVVGGRGAGRDDPGGLRPAPAAWRCAVIAPAVGLVGAYAVVVLLLRARSTGRLAAVDRAALVRAAVDAVVVLALVRAVAPPPGSWSWVWVVAAGLVGVGVAAAALRWPHLPAGRVLPTPAYLVLGALVVAATA